MSERELPELAVTRAELLSLFDRAIEREDFERADEIADVVLAANDVEEDA